MAESADTLRSMLDAMVQRGVVRRALETTKLRSLQIETVADEPIPDVEHVEPLGLTAVPALGAEVLAACPGGNEDQTVALVVFDRSVRPTDGAAGETIIYDSGTGAIQIRLNATAIKLGDGATLGVARTTDAVLSSGGADDLTFWTWIAAVHAVVDGITPLPAVPTTLTSAITGGSATVLAED